MVSVRAFVFDFIGTLTSVKGYSLENSRMKLSRAIRDAGFVVADKAFARAYDRAHEKYRIIRYEELVEVTNAVWISEALKDLGFKTDPEDTRVKTAVNVFFEDYLDSIELRQCASDLLEKASANHRMGMISNFTYAPVIHAALRKLEIDRFFNAILISEEVGWRKPSVRIFEEALRRLRVTAEETIYVGDSPLEDIGGARALGMRTVFVSSQFYTRENLIESRQKPSFIVNDICDLNKHLRTILHGNEL